MPCTLFQRSLIITWQIAFTSFQAFSTNEHEISYISIVTDAVIGGQGSMVMQKKIVLELIVLRDELMKRD